MHKTRIRMPRSEDRNLREESADQFQIPDRKSPLYELQANCRILKKGT